MSAAPRPTESPRPPRKPRGPEADKRRHLRKGAARPAAPAWSQSQVEEFFRRFVDPDGRHIWGALQPDGRTTWSGNFRRSTSLDDVRRAVEAGWESGRLAVKGPSRVQDVVLDLDGHAVGEDERAAQLEAAWALVRRLKALRVRLHVERTPRGYRVLIPLAKEVGADLARNTVSRLLVRQNLVSSEETVDVVRTGRRSLCGLPFSWGAGAAVLFEGSAERLDPIDSALAGAEAFDRYLELRPNRMERLIQLSKQTRRQVGRPSGGAASPDSPKRYKAPSASTPSGPQGQRGRNQYLGSHSGSDGRDQINELLENAVLGSWSPSAEDPGNSSKTRHETALLVEGLGPAELVPGTRRKACLDLVHRARTAGWKPAETLGRIWSWLLERPAGSSADLDRNPGAVLRDLARSVIDVYRWRERHPAKRRGPAVEPDPADLEALAELGLPRATAKHVSKVLVALRERREVGQEVVLSRAWLSVVTGVRGKSTLARIREELVSLGLVEMTASPDRRRGVATTCRIVSLDVSRPASELRLADVLEFRRDELTPAAREFVDGLPPERVAALVDALRLAA
ncbi:hypothetical protein LLG88_00615 [bacterium]|nr:hypothetical protein [bacterium]